MSSLQVKPHDLLERRRTSNDFAWASRTWNCSPYFVCGKAKDPKEVVQAVLASQKVRNAIREISERYKKSEDEISREAHLILSEMAHDYHMYAIRWFGLVLSKLSKRLYNSIQVNAARLDQIKEAYSRCPVLLLPTHRSYVDFLLISYMSFHYGLPLPIIAAGMDFMSMAGIGEMLRKSGAFYIRRRFGGDMLYWALISEYVKTAVSDGGHPMEMFVEGTRSRSGKSLTPKIGLLSSVLELLARDDIPDILILPISMSYDRTLEERLYAHELLGKPKPKESTNLLLKALRFLGSQSYGSVYVNFGNLISARSVLQSCSISSPTIDSSISRQIQQLATDVVVEHQKHLIVPIFSAVSFIILSKVSRGLMMIGLNELICGLESIRAVLKSRSSKLGYPLNGEGFEANVRYILRVHSALVTVQSQSNNLVVLVNFQPGDTVQHMVFQHYANQCLTILLPFSLSCLHHEAQLRARRFVEENDVTNKECRTQIKITNDLVEEYVFMRQLFQEDFVYCRGTEPQELIWAADILNSIKKKEDHQQKLYSSFYAEGSGRIHVDIFEILRHGLEPYLIAYWGMVTTLSQIEQQNQQSPCEMKQLGKMCQEFIHQEMTTHFSKQYGALSLETLTNATLSLVKSEVLARVKLEDGSFGIVVKDSQRLSTILSRLEVLLRVDCLVLNTERHSIESNSEIDSLDSAGQSSKDQQLLRSKL